MLLIAVTLITALQSDDRASILYVECVESEVMRLAKPDRAQEAIVDVAIRNCESLVGDAAQASVNEAPKEALQSYRAAGLTPEMILEVGKRIVREAARETGLHVLKKLRDGDPSYAPNQ